MHMKEHGNCADCAVASWKMYIYWSWPESQYYYTGRNMNKGGLLQGQLFADI
jgi:hypothetical protein